VIEVSDETFESYINEAMDSLPEQRIANLKNVLISFEDVPTPAQLVANRIGPHQTLFGLYEGIPLTARGSGYNLVLPDKITLFKLPLQAASDSLESLKEHVRHTLWHEIAHYYGLDHDRINELE
jgi:predicted Zn-dependent protease with MMP-like domain